MTGTSESCQAEWEQWWTPIPANQQFNVKAAKHPTEESML